MTVKKTGKLIRKVIKFKFVTCKTKNNFSSSVFLKFIYHLCVNNITKILTNISSFNILWLKENYLSKNGHKTFFFHPKIYLKASNENVSW